MIKKIPGFILSTVMVLSGGCQKSTLPVASTGPVTLQANVTQKLFYDKMPSASGIEKAGTGYYVIGDDAPYLYLLDAGFKPAGRFALMDTSGFTSGRLHYKTKPDLESMAQFNYNGGDFLLLLPSGSATNRTTGFIVQADDPKQVRKLDLNRLYTFLQQVLVRNGGKQLNLEGLAIGESFVYVLNRSFGQGASMIFRFKRSAFLDFIMQGGEMPVASVFHFELPKLGPYRASFSGAYLFQDKLFFTASIEGTSDAVADGAVHGSFVGYIPLLDLKEDKGYPVPVPVVQLALADGKMYGGKAESLVVSRTDSAGTYRAVIVSDDDNGNSELLEVELQEK